MRLALKLVLAFLLCNILLAAVYAYFSVRQEVGAFGQTVSAEAEAIGNPLQVVLSDAWKAARYRGVEQAVQNVQQMQSAELHIRWVWFDRRPGQPDAPTAPPESLTTAVIDNHLPIEAVDSSGAEFVDIYWAIPLETDRHGGLEFSHSLAELSGAERQIIVRTAWLIGGMAVASGLIAVVLGARFIARPLSQLVHKTRLIGAGDLAHPLHLPTNDELEELSESLNHMCAQLAESRNRIDEETAARIAAIEQLRHTDRLKTVGRLAAGVAHEMGTPLNVVAGRAGLIASGKLSTDEISASAAAIKGEADKMTRIIRQLLDFARVGTPKRAPIDLRQLVGRTIDLLRPIAESRHVQLCPCNESTPAVATIDAEQMQQALTNLMVNAIQAMPNGGKVELSVNRHESQAADSIDPAGNYWCIAIRDQGTGIAAENIPHLFEPFFTTKDVGQGTGLGLSIAYGIVREHGGRIEVESRLGEGSCFTVWLPEEQTS